MSKQVKKEISEQMLDQQVDQLSVSITPQRDLWQGIERAISQIPQDAISSETSIVDDPKKNAFMPMAWAASFIVAVLVTWLVIPPTSIERTEVAKKVVNSDVKNSDIENNITSLKQGLSTDVAQLMHESFKQQKTAMLVSFGATNHPEISPLMEKQLLELASARQAIEKALSADKNNTDLLNLLRFTQQQELNLLQQLYSPKWQSI